MKYRIPALVACQFLLFAGCTYNSKTNETRFTPLGAGTHELIDVAVKDVKECAGRSCETKTAHDGYEESKIKSMSNEELEAYVKKQKSKQK